MTMQRKVAIVAGLLLGCALFAFAAEPNDILVRMKSLEQQAQALEEQLAGMKTADSQLRQRRYDAAGDRNLFCKPCYEFGMETTCLQCCEANKAIDANYDCEREMRIINVFQQFEDPNRQWKICPLIRTKLGCLHVDSHTKSVSALHGGLAGTLWSISRADDSDTFVIRANPDVLAASFLNVHKNSPAVEVQSVTVSEKPTCAAGDPFVDCGYPGISRSTCEARGCCYDESSPWNWCFPKGAAGAVSDASEVDTSELLEQLSTGMEWTLHRWGGEDQTEPVFRIEARNQGRFLNLDGGDFDAMAEVEVRYFSELVASGDFWDGALWTIEPEEI